MKKLSPQSESKKAYTKSDRRENNIASLAERYLKWNLLLFGRLTASRCEAFFHPCIVNAQELVLRGGHVYKVGLAFGAFLVQELVHRFVGRRFLQVGANHLVEDLTKMRRASFGSRIALCDVLARLVHG